MTVVVTAASTPLQLGNKTLGKLNKGQLVSVLKVEGDHLATSIVAAMTLNYFLNNQFTYRDRKLHGWGLWRGLFLFYIACSGLDVPYRPLPRR
jgi:hypothetical protein